MDAKYVITTKGGVAIFSKYLGMEHAEAAGLMDAFVAEGGIAGAGFCSMVDDQIITFGRSTSTGIAAQPEDAKTLTSLLLTGGLVMVFHETRLSMGWIATNSPDAFEHDRKSPCTPDALRSARIFK